MEELASYDPNNLIVGILGGGKGTTRDCFELLHKASKYGAKVALFGRKINLAEDQKESYLSAKITSLVLSEKITAGTSQPLFVFPDITKNEDAIDSLTDENNFKKIDEIKQIL